MINFFVNRTSGSYLFRGPSDQTVGPLVFFIIKTNYISLTEWTILAQWTIQYPLNKYELGGLFSMVKYTDGPTVWSDEPQNKYDPGQKLFYNSLMLERMFWND